MKRELKITLVVLGICLLTVGFIGGIVVGLNYKNIDNIQNYETNLQVFINKETNNDEIDSLVEKYKENTCIIKIDKISSENATNLVNDKLKNSNITVNSDLLPDSIMIYAKGTEKELNKLKKSLEKESIVSSIETH